MEHPNDHPNRAGFRFRLTREGTIRFVTLNLAVSTLARLSLLIENDIPIREILPGLLRHVRIEGAVLTATCAAILLTLSVPGGWIKTATAMRGMGGVLTLAVLADTLLYVLDLPAFRSTRMHIDFRFAWYLGELNHIGDMIWKEMKLTWVEPVLGTLAVGTAALHLRRPVPSRRIRYREWIGAWLVLQTLLHAVHLFTSFRVPKSSMHLTDNLAVRLVSVTRQGLAFGYRAKPRPEDRTELMEWLGFEPMNPDGEGFLHKPLVPHHPLHGRFRNFNVVFLALESFRARDIGAVNGGDPADVTPFFDSLAQEGILFNRFYSSSVQTIRGLVSAFCSTPDYQGERLFKIAPHTKLICLPRLLADRGYTLEFIYGGDTSYDNLHLFFTTQGVRRFVGYEDFDVTAPRFAWGVHDEALFEKTTSEMDALPEPFSAIVLTLSNHAPYEPPGGGLPLDAPMEERFRSTLRYTDDCLRDFFDRLRTKPYFRRTLFVLFADHGQAFSQVGTSVLANLDDENMRIPFLLVAGDASLAQGIRPELGGHIDISPTVADLLGIDEPTSWWGRSLLDASVNRFAYLSTPFGPSLISLVQGSTKIIYDHSGESFEYRKVEYPFEERRSETPPTDDTLSDRLLQIYRVANYLMATNRLTAP